MVSNANATVPPHMRGASRHFFHWLHTTTLCPLSKISICSGNWAWPCEHAPACRTDPTDPGAFFPEDGHKLGRVHKVVESGERTVQRRVDIALGKLGGGRRRAPRAKPRPALGTDGNPRPWNSFTTGSVNPVPYICDFRNSSITSMPALTGRSIHSKI